MTTNLKAFVDHSSKNESHRVGVHTRVTPSAYSGDWGAADALLAGCDTWFSVVAGLMPAPALALTRAAQSGDAAEARRLNEAFGKLWSLFMRHGSFRVMFALADQLGTGRLQPPLTVLPLSQDANADVACAL